MKNILVGEKLRVVFLVLVGVVSLVIFWNWVNRYILTPQAAQENVGVTMSPKTGEVATGSSKDVTIIVATENATSKISGLDLSLTATGGTISKLSSCTAVGSSGEFSDLISDTGEKGRKSCVSLKPDPELPSSVQFTATVSCSAIGTLGLTLNSGSSQVVGNTAAVEYGFGAVDVASFTCGGGTGDKPKGPHAAISFEPTHCDTAVDGKCDYEMKLAASEEKDRISAYRVKLSFDPKLLKAESASMSASSVLSALAQAPITTPGAGAKTPTAIPNTGRSCTSDQNCINLLISTGACKAGSSCPIRCDIPPGAASGTCVGDPSKITPTISPTISISGSPVNPSISLIPISILPSPQVTPIPLEQICREEIKEINNDAGTIELAYVCAKKTSELPRQMLSKLSFRGLADGSGVLKIVESEVVGTISGGAFSVFAKEASYKVGQGTGGGGTGKVNLDLLLRLQGVIRKPKNVDTIKVRLGIGDGTLTTSVFKETEFKVRDDGLWQGSVSFDVKAGGGYKLLVKGSKHMQKKVCEATPKENFPGSYSCDKGAIKLEEGKNSLDFSSIVLLVGDLEPQDGLSNAHDQSLVRNLLGKSDAESLRLADVNFDGVVNAVDHSLMIAALSVRYDDQ